VRNIETIEDNDRVNPVQEFRAERGAKRVTDPSLRIAGVFNVEDVRRPDIGGHDQDHIAEVHSTTMAIG